MENCCIIYFRGAKICEPSTDSRKLVIIINISTRERFKKFFNMSNPGCMSTIFSILSHVDKMAFTYTLVKKIGGQNQVQNFHDYIQCLRVILA